MKKIIPVVLIGAAVAAIGSYVKKRNAQREVQEPEEVALDPDLSDTILQPKIEAYQIGAEQALLELTGKRVKVLQRIEFTSEDAFFKVVKELKTGGYILEDVGENSAIISREVDHDIDQVMETIQEVFDKVNAARGHYLSYHLSEI